MRVSSPRSARSAWLLPCAIGILVAQACNSSPTDNPTTNENPSCVESNGAPCASDLEGTACTSAVCTACGGRTFALGGVVTCTCTGGTWSCPATPAGTCEGGDAGPFYANPACTLLYDGGVEDASIGPLPKGDGASGD
jgi:hypothetical protein